MQVEWSNMSRNGITEAVVRTDPDTTYVLYVSRIAFNQYMYMIELGDDIIAQSKGSYMFATLAKKEAVLKLEEISK